MQILSNPISALNVCESPKFLRPSGNRGRPEVEIRPFRACAIHPAIIIGTVRSLWTWIWGRYHVPQLLLFLSTRAFVFSPPCMYAARAYVTFAGFGCGKRCSAVYETDLAGAVSDEILMSCCRSQR